MDAYAEPAMLFGRRPIVYLTMNVTPPGASMTGTRNPALMTPLDVRIAFHEFGHGLHMLLSDVRYPRIAGINVAHDVVEYPSKIHESLAFRPDVLARYARHHITGAPVPATDVAALNASIREGAPYTSTQGAAHSLLDQAWHGLAPGETVAPEAVDEFEREVVQRYGLHLRAVGLGNHSTFFTHIFDGHYGGTHYAYLWSALLEAVTLQWLDDQGGLTRANGQRLREAFLSRGAVVDPIAAIRTLTGRDPSVEPLLERRGLTRAG
jgi:peptidyl-dipeptidase Dcp